MAKLEFHAAQGGADSEKFAAELAQAVSRYTARPVVAEGRVLTISRL